MAVVITMQWIYRWNAVLKVNTQRIGLKRFQAELHCSHFCCYFIHLRNICCDSWGRREIFLSLKFMRSWSDWKKKKKDIHTKLTLIPLEGCKHRKVMQIREPEQIRFKLTIVVLLPVLLLLMNDSVESIWKFNIQ